MLSENLRILRKNFKLTQQEVADILGIDRSTYTFYEAGKSTPTKENLVKICDIFNVTVGYLLGVEKNCPDLKLSDRSNRIEESSDGLLEISRNEKFLIMAYRSLDADKKEKLIDLVKTAIHEFE